VRAIQRFHQDRRGFCDIAYSFVFCKHGFVFVGRGWGVRTAAQGTNFGNDHYHAVCFLGDDTRGRDDVTTLGRRALAQLVLSSRRQFGDEVLPHSSFKATACPGDDLRGTIRFGDWHRLARARFPTLRRGSRGADVRVAQRLLRSNRFRQDFRPGPVDGVFGRRTAAACRRAKYALGYPRAEIKPSFGDRLHDFLAGERRLPPLYRARRIARLRRRSRRTRSDDSRPRKQTREQQQSTPTSARPILGTKKKRRIPGARTARLKPAPVEAGTAPSSANPSAPQPLGERFTPACVEAETACRYRATKNRYPLVPRHPRVRLHLAWNHHSNSKKGEVMLTNAQVEAIIPVSDVDEAASFYGEKLGLDVLERIDILPENPEVRFRTPNGTLAAYKSVGAGQSRHTLVGFIVDDVRSAVAALRERGVTFEEYDLPEIKTEAGVAQTGTITAAWFKDPDGNILSINSYG
jgi:catechol 2,3-dioxygenase-like lactoylglutathione lyase family enzyme/peptidoglycan hydrolase-like protein with peptidoglycan-binding domain